MSGQQKAGQDEEASQILIDVRVVKHAGGRRKEPKERKGREGRKAKYTQNMQGRTLESERASTPGLENGGEFRVQHFFTYRLSSTSEECLERTVRLKLHPYYV